MGLERGPGDQKPCWKLTPGLCSCSYYNTTSVLLCLSITALVCFSVTVFSFQTKVGMGPVDWEIGWGP